MSPPTSSVARAHQLTGSGIPKPPFPPSQQSSRNSQHLTREDHESGRRVPRVKVALSVQLARSGCLCQANTDRLPSAFPERVGFFRVRAGTKRATGLP